MINSLPQPPVPADADLRHFGDMPMEVARVRDSRIVKGDAEVFRCAFLLWCSSWQQVPAGSLPDDDLELSHLVGLGRDLKTWRKLKAASMQGWLLFSDGRYYHKVVCEKVIAGLNSTRQHHWNKACGRVRKENHKRAKQRPKLDRLPMPDRPAPLTFTWPETVTERAPGGVVRVPERGISSEWNGMDIHSRSAQDGHAPRNGSSHPPLATREGLEGPARDDVQKLIGRAANIVRVPA